MSDQVQASSVVPAAESNASAPAAEANQQQSVSQETQLSDEAQAAASDSDAAIDANPKLSKAEKKMLKSLKIKYNGKEIEEKLPFEIPDDPETVKYMQDTLQLKKQASTKAQEMASMQKEITAFFEALKTDPRKVLSDPRVGVDLKKIAMDLIEEEIANAQKSPEEIAKEKLERELKELKEERDREKKEFEQREIERLQEQAYVQYETLMTQALDKSDLPKSPYVVKKMADYLLTGIQEGLDVKPEDVIGLVRDEIQNDLKEMFAVMPEEVAEAIIGKDTLNRVRKKQLARAKVSKEVPAPVHKAAPDTANSSKKEEPVVKKPMRDFFGF